MNNFWHFDNEIKLKVADAELKLVHKNNYYIKLLLLSFLILSFLFVANVTVVNAAETGEVWEWRKSISNTKVAGLDNVSDVSTSKYHNLVLKDDGTVWSWGLNGTGQLGNGTTAASSSPIQVLSPTGNGYITDVRALSAGSSFSVALKTDGTVWLWGNNLLLNAAASNSYSTRPFQVMAEEGVPLKDIIAIAAGEHHVLALSTNGTVFEWGFNVDKHLEQVCPLNSECSASNYPMQIKDADQEGHLTDVKAIAAGYNHNLVAKNDGSVWGWGGTAYGQLGLSNKNTTYKVYPVNIQDLNNIEDVSAKYNYNLALDHAGQVYEWGDGFFLPKERPYLGEITSISAGYASSGHGFAIDSKGDALHWLIRAQNSFPDIVENASEVIAIAAQSDNNMPYLYVTSGETIPTPTQPPQNILIDYKQTDPQWGQDRLENSQNCGTLYNFGCAVTSVADVFYSYGKTTLGSNTLDPGTLNNWLATNRGFDSCSIYWGTASAAVNIGAPTIKFRNGSADWVAGEQAIDAALNNGYLPILGVYTSFGTHFFAVSEKLPDVNGKQDYRIIDPALYPFTANNPGNTGKSLSQVYGGFDKVFEYIIYRKGSTPQNTLTIRAHSPVQLLITDPQGNQTGYDEGTQEITENIPESTYGIEGGIAPVDGSAPASGETKYFQQIDPSEGEYSIQLIGTGNGSYKLDFAKTDEEGNASTHVIEGFAQAGVTETYSLEYTEGATEDPVITREVTFDVLKNDLKRLYELEEIKKKSLFKRFVVQTKLAERFSVMNRQPLGNKLAILTLKTFQYELNRQRDKQITENAYQILNLDIEYLLGNLQNGSGDTESGGGSGF